MTVFISFVSVWIFYIINKIKLKICILFKIFLDATILLKVMILKKSF